MMEDKRTAFAILLCTTIVIIYSQVVFAPYNQQRTQQAQQQAAQSAVQAAVDQQNLQNLPQQQINNPGQPPAVAQQPGTNTALVKAPTSAEIERSGFRIVRNQKLEAGFTLLGGRLQSLKLNNYKKNINDAEKLNLVSHAEGTRLPLGIYTSKSNDLNTLYTITKLEGFNQNADGSLEAAAGQATIELQGTLSDGKLLTKKLIFTPDHFNIRVEASTGEPAEPVYLEWAEHLPDALLHERYDPRQFTFLTKDGDLNHVMLNKFTNGMVQSEGNSKWVSITDHYFISSIIPSVEPALAMMSKEGESYYLKLGGTQTATAPASFNVYVGPKTYDDLKTVGVDLERSIDLGFFSFIAYPLLSLIKFFFSILGNYGLAIIALTLLIKLLFLPLTSASMKAGKAMQAIQPEIQELRARIKDATQLNQEMMALYKRRNVNPMAGCLPMLIQIPVFFGLYQALLNSISLRHAPFALWITDLSSPEKLQVFGIGIPLMILLMGGSMYFQQKLQPSSLDPQQQKIMNLMPLVFTGMFIVYPMPSGLVLYWLVNNAISIVQQTALKSETGKSPLVSTIIASVIIFVFGYVLTLL